MKISSLLLLAGLAWSGAGPAADAPQPLRVMTLNILYGGDEINLETGDFCNKAQGCAATLDQVIAVIRNSGADVVGLEEAEHNTRAIADALGWHYLERLQVISKLPLIDPPGTDGNYAFIELSKGKVAAIANFHLPSDPYGPYLVRDGGSLDEVLALEDSVRVPAATPRLPALQALADAGIAVFVTGDFNSPSHLDWTAAVSAVRAEVPYPVLWPASLAFADAGFVDSYRQVHPDPVALPGFTWTPGGPETDPQEVHDRIDWVLSAGPAVVTGSQIVGETGGPDVDIGFAPWPTDHRGVVATYQVTPAKPPVYVAVDRRSLDIGDELTLKFHAPGNAGEQLAIVPAGATLSQALKISSTGKDAPNNGEHSFATKKLGAGTYDAVLADADGAILSRSPFWLYTAGTATSVATSKAVYQRGENIDVSWTQAPGMRWDWIALFRYTGKALPPTATTCNTGSCGSGNYLMYEYTRTAIEGSAQLGAGSAGAEASWPLKPGQYEVRMLLDDGYRLVARSLPFEIVK
jgi:hypothetical protein